MSETFIARTGVMGWPVAHSRSPAIHGHWLRVYGLRGSYQLCPVQPDEVKGFMQRLRSGELRGVNVTVPHKEAVMAHLDHIDELARSIGAVNTITREEDGSLHGTNTDAYGFIAHLKKEVPHWKDALAHPVILGAGGAARGVLKALLDAGAQHVIVTNRTFEHAQALAQVFGEQVEARPWDEREKRLADASLLVNTTSLGMQGKPPLELSLEALPASAVVYDIVYAPLETQLLADANAKGCATVDGLGMLLYQAQKAFERWWGILPEVTPELRKLVLEAA